MKSKHSKSPLRKTRAEAMYQRVAAWGPRGTTLDRIFDRLLHWQQAGSSMRRDWSRENIERAIDDLAQQGRVRLRVRECAVFVKAVESDAER